MRSGGEIKNRNVVGFVGWSGTGKTTVIEEVIRVLTGRGFRVGALKHNSHKMSIDHPGKDSARFTAAGAENMVLVSEDTVAAVIKQRQPVVLGEILDRWFGEMDLVIIEGFKGANFPKVEIFRQEIGKELICRGSTRDDNLIAVATNTHLDIDVPLLDLNRTESIIDFLESEFLT